MSASRAALAFLASLAAASAILHSIKIVLGRRRPRDEFDFGLYGFMPFRFAMQYDSFPSGHAMTICCVAVILSGAVPVLAPLWFAGALYLALTRAVLNAHFLSDVFVGAGIGIVTTREVVVNLFPAVGAAMVLTIGSTQPQAMAKKSGAAEAVDEPSFLVDAQGK